MMLNLPIMIYLNIMYHKTILGIKLRNYVYDGQTIAMPIERKRKQHELQDTDALIKSGRDRPSHITCASVAALATT